MRTLIYRLCRRVYATVTPGWLTVIGNNLTYHHTGKEAKIYRCRNGLNMLLPVREARLLGIAYLGEAAPIESDWMRANIRPGDVFVDAGGYLDGWHGFLAATLGAKSYIVEPVPAHVDWLRAQRALNNSSAEIVEAALSDSSGTCLIHVSDHSSSVLKDWARFEHTLETPMLRLDQITSKLDILKLDTEGNEEDVLAGCGDLLDNCRAVFTEVNSGALRRVARETLMNSLTNQGFKPYAIRREGLKTYVSGICESETPNVAFLR